MSEELKACPFCGMFSMVEGWQTHDFYASIRWYYARHFCEILNGWIGTTGKTKEDCYKKWNTRTEKGEGG